METTKKHLATMEHGRVYPINHGLVSVTDNGWILREGYEATPVEDFGMFFLRDEPFPPTNSKELFDIFLELLKDDEV